MAFIQTFQHIIRKRILFTVVFSFLISCHVGNENPKYREYTAEETRVILRNALMDGMIAGLNLTDIKESDSLAMVVAPEVMTTILPLKPDRYYDQSEVHRCADTIRTVAISLAAQDHMEAVGFSISACNLVPSGSDFVHWEY